MYSTQATKKLKITFTYFSESILKIKLSLIFNMDGSFLGRYETKIKEWETLIKSDPENKEQYKSEMFDYMAACIPYLQKLSSESSDKHTIDTIFSTTSKKGIQRKEIYHEYLRNVEKFTGVIENEAEQKQQSFHKCDRCGTSNIMFMSTCETVCGDCGCTILLLGDELSYKDEQEIVKVVNYSYKRDNHFNEWLLQFQAQETTHIPGEVIEQIRSEFKKQKIKNISDITHAKVRSLLKKLRLNKYYEHVPYISNILNGMQPPKMTQKLEDRLRMMFKDIQEPFNKHCPESRKNFLSYSYVLYKFCELLGEDDYLPCFPLLKSKEKLYQQDVIWKQICKELHWEYISTI
jgi:hypothetical protein